MRTLSMSIVLMLMIFAPVLAFATGQQGNVLLLNEKRYAIHTNPLEAYLEKHPNTLPISDVISTANWRGYIATWEVRADRFLLRNVEILQSIKKQDDRSFSTELRSVMDTLFPGQKDVVADWFTGHVIVPNGKLVEYVHMGYASTYQKYILLRVERGVVTRIWNANRSAFKRFRDSQFAAFKTTDEYREALADVSKDQENKMKESQAEEFLREFYAERYMSLIFNDSSLDKGN